MLQVELNMEKWRDVEIAGNTVARFLGCNCPKSEQRLTVNENVKPQYVLVRLQGVGAAIHGKSNNLNYSNYCVAL